MLILRTWFGYLDRLAVCSQATVALTNLYDQFPGFGKINPLPICLVLENPFASVYLLSPQIHKSVLKHLNKKLGR